MRRFRHVIRLDVIVLIAAFMALWFIPLFGIQFMPESWKQVISRSLVGIDPMQVILTATVILLAIDSALMAVGFYRFQRSRLELE